MPEKLCVIFDIDETLIHFIQRTYKDIWDKELKSKAVQYDYVNDKDHIIIFRPYLKELFTYFNNHRDSISVALWTYSERDYAEDVGNQIIKFCGLPKDFFLFRYGSEDMDGLEKPKELTHVYKKFPKFNVFNTMLVDDLFNNIQHTCNKQNSVLIAPFAPFGLDKKRVKPKKGDHAHAMKDDCLQSVMSICQALVKDIQGCDESDFEHGFKREHVFSESRLKRMKIDNYLKNFLETRQMMNIGSTYLPSHIKFQKTKNQTTKKKKSKSFSSKRKTKTKSLSKSY